MADSNMEVLTIGHSTQSYEEFLRRLRDAEVTAVADVRSTPFSRHLPHFNSDTLRDELRLDKIAYVFLGDELGGRPKERQFFCEGVADYAKMAHSEAFKKGLDRVAEGARKYTLALMCSEQDPLDCHRCLLVGRALAAKGVKVRHILIDGSTVEHAEIENRLLDLTGRAGEDLFLSREGRLAAAYRERAAKVAYAEHEESRQKHVAAE